MATTKVNKDLCIGCGACTIVDEVFEIGNDGLAETKENYKITEENIDEVKDAAEGCPTSAIDVEE